MFRSFFLIFFIPFTAFAASEPSNLVMGPSAVAAFDRARFLTTMNPAVDLATALNYSLLYDEEAQLEGVNPDLAFAQMLLETSYLKFGGQVKSGQNNFAGLGAVDGGDKGLIFSSPRLGIRAQVQHLKYYASNLPLVGAPINPRLGFVKRASAPTVALLARSWASDPEYGNKLMALMARMVAHAGPSQEQTRNPSRSVEPSPLPRNRSPRPGRRGPLR